MAFTKRHPALPEDSGYFLYSERGRAWSAGYQGKEFKHQMLRYHTEAEAIDGLQDLVRKHEAERSNNEIVQRFLCSAWVAA